MSRVYNRTLTDGLAQIADYMDKAGVNEGHLIIFDRRANRTWDEKIFMEVVKLAGVPDGSDHSVRIWGM